MSEEEKSLMTEAVELVITPSMRKALRAFWLLASLLVSVLGSVIVGTWKVVSFVGEVRNNVIEVQAANRRLESRLDALDAHVDSVVGNLDHSQRETERMVQRHEGILNRINN